MTESKTCFLRLSNEWWDTLQWLIQYLISNKLIKVRHATCVLVRMMGHTIIANTTPNT